jgi:WD40 repeat protein
MYDGFISYSHAADDLLAPRLQAGLQRFAKPWWKRRAVRIFRDESSLSANPHLWSSITEALDTSDWFVLLLSEDAASSEWVGKEIEHWVTNKDSNRILPVVTDGEFGWNSDGDVTGTSVPPALHGVFAEEPRWVDLRFARDEEQLDLQNPEFSSAVADVASAIRGVAKDELASEEVRQHRRTVRTAWSAGALLLLLAIAAAGFGIQSANNANLAEENAVTAQANADLASAEADRANGLAEQEAAARAEAVTNEGRAQENAALARSQALAAASTSVLESDPELSMLLAIASVTEARGLDSVPGESLRALRKADASNPLRVRIPFEAARLEVTPDGRSILAQSELEYASFDLESGSEIWRTTLASQMDEAIALAISPDGSLIVASGLIEGDPPTGAVVVLSTEDGSVLAEFSEPCPPGWYPYARPFTPDGSIFALGTGDTDCEIDPDQDWVSFRDTGTWEEVGRLSTPGRGFEGVSFSADGTRLLVDSDADAFEVLAYPSLELIRRFEGYGPIVGAVTMSPNGKRVAFLAGAGIPLVRIHDVESGEFLGFAEGHGLFVANTGSPFGPQSESLLVLSRDGTVLVDSANGRLLSRLGSNETAFQAAFSPDGRSVVTSERGDLLIWSLAGSTSQVPLAAESLPASHINPNRLLDGPTAAVHSFLGTLGVDDILALLVIDETTGNVVDSVPTANAAQLPDGRFVIAEQEAAGQIEEGALEGLPELRLGGLSIWDPLSDTRTPLTECEILRSDIAPFADEPTRRCSDGEPFFGIHDWAEAWLTVSPDGSMVAASSDVLEGRRCLEESRREIRVWNVETAAELSRFEIDGCSDLVTLGPDWLVVADGNEGGAVLSLDGTVLSELDQSLAWYLAHVTPDGRYLVTAGFQGDLAVLDTEDWSVMTHWDGHPAFIRGLALSPDGDRFATAGEDGSIRIWDLAWLAAGLAEGQRPMLLDEIPVGFASDIRWLEGNRLGYVLRRPGAWATVSLDPDELVQSATARLTRSFSTTECQNFVIDPCPTLEDLQEG